ncbi:MAG: hypothetical protein ACWA5L_08655 [bacterium]
MVNRQTLFLGLAALMSALTACATPTPPSVPPLTTEQVLAKTIKNVCYDAVSANVSAYQHIQGQQFSIAVAADQKYKSQPQDSLYRADFANAPILISIAPDEMRCDVIVVRGDHDQLKRAAEDVIAWYADHVPAGASDHLALIEYAPHKGYALKFTLLSGDEVKE